MADAVAELVPVGLAAVDTRRAAVRRLRNLQANPPYQALLRSLSKMEVLR
jgi:hypothetical protein